MNSIKTWIRDNEINGYPTFSFEDVTAAFPNKSDNTVATELSRLGSQGFIQAVHKGFYTVIPTQYKLSGIVPPYYYIDQLMSHLCKPYYLSLLTAASLHGAAHQRPQYVYVTTIPPRMNTSQRLNNTIVWDYRRQVPEALLWKRNSETGIIKFSSPELTAVDLVQRARDFGGMSGVAVVLVELAESLDFTRNFELLFNAATTRALQKLGCLLETFCGASRQAKILYDLLTEKTGRLKYIPLKDDGSLEGWPKDTKWKIIINTGIETDEVW